MSDVKIRKDNMLDENCYFCKKLLADDEDTYFIGAFEGGNPYIEDATILSWVCDECGKKVIVTKSDIRISNSETTKERK